LRGHVLMLRNGIRARGHNGGHQRNDVDCLQRALRA
jgi:hypothetical protein